MKISVIGAGYVGLVSAAGFAELGNQVLCLDVDPRKIALLMDGQIPIHEPGLTELVTRNVAAGRLHFTTDAAQAARFGKLQFIAVGTPPDEDGSADLRHVLAAARQIGRHLGDYTVVVNKSTVPVGTADRVRGAIAEELALRGLDLPFSVVSNPEFLKEGAAVNDFMRPDRVVVGADDPRAIDLLRTLYAPIMRNHDRLLVMGVRSAELTKYAANAMLATRISFMNELANLAEALGADIEQVRHGMGSDSRIGTQFLYAGCGYGGSCFPKDVKALISTAAGAGVDLQVARAVEAANERQKTVLPAKLMARLGSDLTGRHIALWGLAFKPETDDLREATSQVVINALLAQGASVAAYDPVAMPAARALYAGEPRLSLAPSALAALEGADALVIVTEWKEFRSVDLGQVRDALRQPLVFDGRNLYDPALARAAGLEYRAIGRPA